MSAVKFTFRGLMAPVFSPFNNDAKRTLNLSSIPQYAQFLASKKIKGVLVNGTTGEGTSLTIDERKKSTEAWAQAVKRTGQHLMVQIGGAALQDVKELASHAENIGADSLLCLPELFFRPFSTEALIDYLKEVSAAAPRTPLLYYHIPCLSLVNLHMGRFLEAAGSKVPTLVGIKFTHSDMQEAAEAIAANPKFTVFLGSDVLMAPGCTMGMDSFIMTSLNFIPEPSHEILEFGKGSKDLKSAQKNQELLSRAVGEITRNGNWVEGMKVAMNLTTGLFMGPPRAPNKLLTREQLDMMDRGLAQLGIQTNKAPSLKLYN